MNRRVLAALLGLMLMAGAASVGNSASPPLQDSVQPFQLPDQHGRMQRIEPSSQNTLVYFYRGDW